MEYLLDLLKDHWRLISAVSTWFTLTFALNRLGRFFERFTQKQNLLNMWLSEIGSDIRIYGPASAAFLTIAYIATIYSVYLSWLLSISLISARFTAVVWLVMILIALVESAAPYYQQIVEQAPVNERDKRNMLTLIPIAASALKILIYIAAFILGVGATGINITPFLNITTVLVALLGLAGTQTVQDVFASFKIFIDRVYYVGSIIEIGADGICKYEGKLRGRVIKITLFKTFIQLDDNQLLTIDNGVIRSVIVFIDNTVQI